MNKKGGIVMKVDLIDVTKENWLQVLFLTTNAGENPTLCEEFVASNALSIVQSIFETGWIVKAVEVEGNIVGFAMYGYNEEQQFYELCRIMIDYKYQGKGYGTAAIRLVIEEMKKDENCDVIYLSTEPENQRAKRIYTTLGFKETGRQVEGEDLFCLSIKEK